MLQHVVDLDRELVLAARVTPANAGDAETMIDSVMQAQLNLDTATETSDCHLRFKISQEVAPQCHQFLNPASAMPPRTRSTSLYAGRFGLSTRRL